MSAITAYSAQRTPPPLAARRLEASVLIVTVVRATFSDSDYASRFEADRQLHGRMRLCT